MGTGTPTILTARADGVATITLNRPEVRNALDMTMRRDLEAALVALDADPGVRVVVVRGAGDHFCAGGDVKLMRDNPMTAAEGQSRVEAINRAILALARFRAPTIAMVDGAAAGAGCNIALACDLVIASDRARFGEMFARIGLIPDAGGTYFLPRRVGLARAKELVFTGDIVDAREAERIGLINRVVPVADLEAETYALARRIADGPPPSAGGGEDAPRPCGRSRSGIGAPPGGAHTGRHDRGRGPPRGASRVLREAAATVHVSVRVAPTQALAAKRIPNP